MCVADDVLVMEPHKGLIPAALMRILRQQLVEEGGQHFAQATTSAVCTAVICQNQACLRHCLC